MAKDNDALTTGSQSPQKGKTTNTLDDLANMFGGLKVEAKQCQMCTVVLSEEETTSGMRHCAECHQVSETLRQSKKRSENLRKSMPKGAIKKERKSRLSNGSNSEGDGEWIVDEDQQQPSNHSIAGGLEDEDADGGGETLGSLDTDSESDVQARRTQRRKVTEDTDDEDARSHGSETSGPDYDESEVEDAFTKPPPAISAKIRHLLHILAQESPKQKIIEFWPCRRRNERLLKPRSKARPRLANSR